MTGVSPETEETVAEVRLLARVSQKKGMLLLSGLNVQVFQSSGIKRKIVEMWRKLSGLI